MLGFESGYALKLWDFPQFQNIFACIAVIWQNTDSRRMIFKWKHACTFEEIVQISSFRKPCVTLAVLLFRDVTPLTWPALWHHFLVWPFQESKLFFPVWSWKANHRGSVLSAHRQYYYCISVYVCICTIYTRYKNLFSKSK